MNSFKFLIKSLLPPILTDFLRPYFTHQMWSGNFKTWDDAKKLTRGYSSPEILTRVQNSLRMVTSNQAAYERDSVTFDKIDYSYGFLSSLLYIVIKSKNRLSLIDFGGSLGSTYFQYRNLLNSLHVEQVSWNVVEQNHFVDAGNSEFSNEQLKFYSEISGVSEGITGNTALLLSGTLQYLEEPFYLIEQIQEKYDFKYIILNRLPLHFGKGLRLTIQDVPPSIYPASYPCWFFNKVELLSLFQKRYKVVFEFKDPIDHCSTFDSEFMGFLLEKH